MRFPTSNDSRLLVVGIVAFVALATYLGVAFANTRALVNVAQEVAPWTPSNSTLTPVPLGRGRVAVLVKPATKGTIYGAVVQTLISEPKVGHRYVVSLRLKGTPSGRIGIELNEFSPGVARYPVKTTVHATAKWHRFRFAVRVKKSWLGLAVYLYRQTNPPALTSFGIRDENVSVSPG